MFRCTAFVVAVVLVLFAEVGIAQPAPPPGQACGFTLPEDREGCLKRTQENETAMAVLERRREAATMDGRCFIHCSMLEEHLAYRRYIRPISIKAIRAMSAGGRAKRSEALAELEAKRDALQAQQNELDAELAELRRGRVIYLYQNSETGALVEHAGNYFDPAPPLVAVGERRAPQTDSGNRKIAALEERAQKLDEDLAEVEKERANKLTPEFRDHTDDMIEQMWGRDCTAAEAHAWIEDCELSCDGGHSAVAPKSCPM